MSQSPEFPLLGKRRILVVDDEPTLRLAFSYALRDANTEVDSVGDGRSALDRLAVRHFDLLILDLRMPHFDGAAVIDAVRETGNQVPVILCVSVLNPGLVARAGRHGVVDFLLKPVLPSPLRQAADAVLHPERWPYPDAWKAARQGDFVTAAGVLSAAPAPSPRDAAWLGIWQPETEKSPSGRAEGGNLNLLALNGQTGR
ncbi:MAG: response regulator [Verrucomicrobiota bacterium]